MDTLNNIMDSVTFGICVGSCLECVNLYMTPDAIDQVWNTGSELCDVSKYFSREGLRSEVSMYGVITIDLNLPG